MHLIPDIHISIRINGSYVICTNLVKLRNYSYLLKNGFKVWIFSHFVSLVQGVDYPDTSLTLSKWNAQCNNLSHTCFVQFNSSQNVITNGLDFIEEIFKLYSSNGNYLSFDELTFIFRSFGITQRGDENASEHHDHSKHVHNDDIDDDEDSIDDSEYYYDDADFGDEFNDTFEEYSNIYNYKKCLKTPEDVIEEYYNSVSTRDVNISISDFYMILPSLIHTMQNSRCRQSRNHDAEGAEKESTLKVWSIALGSVAVISLLSLIGIVILPLMRHSKAFNRLLSFLVALAVGTLIGDALLHLLPHAASGGDHHHGHDAGELEEEHATILKNLVAVLGIYVFFVFESGMSMWRKKKERKVEVVSKIESRSIVFNSPTSHGEDELSVLNKLSNDNGYVCSSIKHENEITKKNGIIYNGVSNPNGKIPPFPLKLDLNDADNNVEDKPKNKGFTSENDCDYPHHHHHDNHLHEHDIAKATSVKDLVWMVIAGDGLHNFSDGLAIGAAFTGSISAGLSTSLAIFCHELPHEFGDFAILIDSGMPIRKAITYNAMSACIAFIGTIIGLLIGEYTTNVKLWILAVTAGGFLYVALVDMLPQMLRQCVEVDGRIRFLFNNIGFLTGIGIMMLIAWFEQSFLLDFEAPENH